MRVLIVGCGSIQIASVSGERRYVRVSGVAKVQFLWLFRNFYILDCPVLSRKQQQLVARLWQAGASAASVDALDLIGSIEGFSPPLYQPAVAAPKSSRLQARLGLSSGLRVRAIWSAVGVALLGCAMGLGAKFGRTPQPHVAAVSTSRASAANPVSSTIALPALTSAKSEPAVADIPAATEVPPEEVRPPDVRLPDAMATPSVVTPSVMMRKPQAVKRPAVMIRVRVDGQGRAQGFEVVRGEQKKVSAALATARHWAFQPCPGGAECEHMLRFTDYGGASVVRMID